MLLLAAVNPIPSEHIPFENSLYNVSSALITEIKRSSGAHVMTVCDIDHLKSSLEAYDYTVEEGHFSYKKTVKSNCRGRFEENLDIQQDYHFDGNEAFDKYCSIDVAIKSFDIVRQVENEKIYQVSETILFYRDILYSL